MDFSNISIQWFRVHPKESNKEIISGGTLSLSLSLMLYKVSHIFLFFEWKRHICFLILIHIIVFLNTKQSFTEKVLSFFFFSFQY